MRSFKKMHGLGNDFVVLDCRTDGLLPPSALLKRIADRRFGVGCDQLVLLLPPTLPQADLFIRFMNPDGSEPQACGNATRCAARLLLAENGRAQGLVQTIAGLLPVARAGKTLAGADLYSVDIATPELRWDKIPLAQPCETLALDLSIGALTAPCAVNVGNPHAVFFVPDVAAIDLAALGPQIEQHPLFPERVNVELCQVLAPDKLRMRVWERGAGITHACGSGAAATLVAAVRRGLAARKAEIILDGGVLQLEWRDDDRVILTGTADYVCDGVLTHEFCAGVA